MENFNAFDDVKEFAKNPTEFIKGKSTDIAKGKFCEAAGGIPFIGPAICSEPESETPPTNDSEGNEGSGEEGEDSILKGTPLEEPNNKMKEQLVGTPLENLGIEPIFLVVGLGGFFFILLLIIILIVGLGLLYYFYEPGIDSQVDGIMKQYEFPIPPPPPPPPVNFVMDADIINN